MNYCGSRDLRCRTMLAFMWFRPRHNQIVIVYPDSCIRFMLSYLTTLGAQPAGSVSSPLSPRLSAWAVKPTLQGLTRTASDFAWLSGPVRHPCPSRYGAPSGPRSLKPSTPDQGEREQTPALGPSCIKMIGARTLRDCSSI